MDDKAHIVDSGLVDAHVRFELDRWTGAALQESVDGEIAALFGWLSTVQLADLFSAEQVHDWAERLTGATPPSEEFARTIDACIRAVYEALAAQDVPVGDLLSRDDYDRVADVVIGLRQIRPEVITQITTSAVYSQLVAHVLYHGIKTYLVTENAVARKIPGASSLFRMGQNAISSAAPGLEKSIDKTLISFINGNIKETIRDSSTFLNAILDDTMMKTVAEEIWAVNAGRTLGSTVSVMDGSSLEAAIDAGRGLWLRLRRRPVVGRLLGCVVDELFLLHGDKPVATLLEQLGITQDLVARELGAAVGPIVARARHDGYLETRIRHRLEAFYQAYLPAVPAPKTRVSRKRSPMKPPS